jgi:glutaredoxin
VPKAVLSAETTPNLDDAFTGLNISSRERSRVNTSQLAQAHADTHGAALPTVTVLVTTGCHYCEDARVELSTRAERGELELVVVPIESEQGQALQAAHRPGMFPLVLLDGKAFSIGRLPRRKLDRAIANLEAR